MGVCANATAACTRAHNYPISYPTNTQATLHNTQATLHNTQATLHNTQATLHDTQATLHNTQATLHNTQATLHNTQATLHNTQATLHNTQATLHNTWEHKLHALSKLCELHGLPSQLCSVKSLNTPLSHARNTHIIYTLCA